MQGDRLQPRRATIWSRDAGLQGFLVARRGVLRKISRLVKSMMGRRLHDGGEQVSQRWDSVRNKGRRDQFIGGTRELVLLVVTVAARWGWKPKIEKDCCIEVE